MRISRRPFRLGSFPVRFINTTHLFVSSEVGEFIFIELVAQPSSKVQIKFPNLIHLITNSITRDWLQNWNSWVTPIPIATSRVESYSSLCGSRVDAWNFWREFRRVQIWAVNLDAGRVSHLPAHFWLDDLRDCRRLTTLSWFEIHFLFTKTINWQQLGKVNERTASITHVLSFGGWSWIRSRTGSHRRSNSWRWRRHLLLMFIAARHRLAHDARLLFQLADH